MDNGSRLTKAGYAGESRPRWFFPTLIGYPRYRSIMTDVDHYNRDYYVGEEAQQLRGVLNIVHPVECGLVVNWDAMTKVWSEFFERYFQINPSEHPILLTEPPLNPARNREKMVETLFETFNVPAMFVSMSAGLSFYASGRTTGLVVDMGEDVTHIVPIHNSVPITQAISRFDIGGGDITDYFRRLHLQRGYTWGHGSVFEIVRDMKERLCYVALDPENELETDQEEQYILPDGETITAGTERFLAPEAYFNPPAMGRDELALPEAINNAIQQCDLDIRPVLYQNIVLSGGSSLFPGLMERLHKEFTTMLPKNLKIQVITLQEGQYGAWIGGSLLSSSIASKQLWITREDYKKKGVSVINH
ncbi:MAG: actin, cytoplasmic 2 [Candidatus Hodarchaeota archaeon]